MDDFAVLPEGCISNIISLTTPRDACRVSGVSTTFLSASESDGVWDKFLPSDYRDILARSSSHRSSSMDFDMKKKLYLSLSDSPILIDEGKKSFSLDKWSGKKCYMIAARELTIIWGDMPSYWTWTAWPDSRFPEVAELQHVCWLEIRGRINTSMLSPKTKYSAYMIFKLTGNAHGFQQHPVEVSFDNVGNSETNSRTLYLDPGGKQARANQIVHRRVGIFRRARSHMFASQEPVPDGRDDRSPKQRKDRWYEIELGEYYIEGGEAEDLEMSLVEVKGGDWKSGLLVQGIEIRPKNE